MTPQQTNMRTEAAARALYEQESRESGSPDPWPSWESEGNAARAIFRTHAVVAIAASDKFIDMAAAKTRNLIADLTDPDDCWFDHSGGCQAHGYLSLQPGEKCPQLEAKEWVTAFDAEASK